MTPHRTHAEEDVIVYVVRENGEVQSWGRDTFAVACEFVRNPKWPAHPTDTFIAVDDWGYGRVCAAQDENLLGLKLNVVRDMFKRERGQS